MDIVELAPRVIYYKGAIENSDEIVEFLESKNEDPLINEILPPWDVWWDGRQEDSGHSWVPDVTRGYLKNLNWDKHINFTTEYERQFPHVQLSADKYTAAHKAIKPIMDSIDIPLTSAVRDYCDRYDVIYPQSISKNYHFRKYDIGGYVGPHQDQSGPELNMDHSILIYLNDDYNGNDFTFVDLDITFKPEKGSILIFNSDQFHYTTELEDGPAKYYIPFFWHSEEYQIVCFREKEFMLKEALKKTGFTIEDAFAGKLPDDWRAY